MALEQVDYRGYADDDTPGSATPKASINADWTQAADENFRVRLNIYADGTEKSLEFTFYYDLNGDNNWQQVISSSGLFYSSSIYYPDEQDDNVQRIGDGTFSGGLLDEDGVAGEGGTIDIQNKWEFEIETCLQIDSADFSDGDVLRLRAYESGSPISAYTQEPSITISISTGQTLNVSGSLGFAGALSNLLQKQFSGALSFTGALTNLGQKLLSGDVSFVGTLETTARKLIQAVGSLDFSGALDKFPQKKVDGSLDFSGALERAFQKLLSSAVGFVGTLSKSAAGKTTLDVAGVLGFSGEASKTAAKALDGSISLAGTLVQMPIKILESVLDFTGALATSLLRVLSVAGSLDFTNTTWTSPKKVLTGLLDFSKLSWVSPKKLFSSDLSMSGGLKKLYKHACGGVVSFSASVSTSIFRAWAQIRQFVVTIVQRIKL